MTSPNTFGEALDTIKDTLPLLGDERAQAAMLRFFLAVVQNDQVKLDGYVALMDEAITGTPRPATTAATLPVEDRPWFPEPASFSPEVLIGAIAGEPVYGLQVWTKLTGTATRHGVRCMINGLDVHAWPGDPSNPHDADPCVNFGTEFSAGGCGDIRLADWGKMRELAQMPSDPVAQLMALARRWCAGEERARAVAAD